MIGNSIEQIALLFLIAALVSMGARRLRLPYTVGLTLAGIVASFLPQTSSINLTKELVFDVFLPPLIFEAALQMKWTKFKAELPVTTTLATLGVLMSSAIIAIGIHGLLAWPWAPSLVTAVLISATDPVAVIASFREFTLAVVSRCLSRQRVCSTTERPPSYSASS